MSLSINVSSRVLAVVAGGAAMLAQLAVLTLFSHLSPAAPALEGRVGDAHCATRPSAYVLSGRLEIAL